MSRKDIICVTMTTWEGDYMKTIVHMMSQLAKNHRVLFVDYPFTYKDVLTGILKKSNAPVKRILGISKRLRKLTTRQGHEIYHLTLPPIFPSNWINDASSFQEVIMAQSHIIVRSICNAMQKTGMTEPTVINAFNPIIGLPMVGRLDESQLIYYCYDEIRAAQWCGKHGGLMEDEFLQLADQVIVTSEGLKDTKSLHNPHTTLVKNGVDFDLFHQAYFPDRFRRQRKVIGYTGSLDFRLDYDLLAFLAALHPEFDFHFVGRITDPNAEKKLGQFQNVTFFGARQPNDLPLLMQAFDLGIIPFVKNEFTKNIYPLKINEYLAAGLPVVSTDFAPLIDFEKHILIGKDHEEIQSGVVRSLANDYQAEAERRIEIARSNDWSVRAIQVEEVLNNQPQYV